MTEDYQPTHEQIQMAFVDYVTKKYPEIAKHIVRIANDGKRSYYEGRKQKKLGLCKGASDLFIAWPQRQHMADGSYGRWIDKCGLWLEIKTAKDKESPEQMEFRTRMVSARYEAKTAWGIDQAIAIFEAYI